MADNRAVCVELRMMSRGKQPLLALSDDFCKRTIKWTKTLGEARF